MGNPFVHVELHTTDAAAARRFYENVLDWKIEDIPAGDGAYTMITVGEGTGGGIVGDAPRGASAWLAYVAVDDIEATTKRAKRHGAKVRQPVTETPFGWLSVIEDPTGGTFGLWQGRQQ